MVVRACLRPRTQNQRELGTAMPVSEKSIMADALLTVRQDVQQEPAYELVGCERHRLHPYSVAIVAPREGDAAIVDCEEPVIGDGNAVPVANQIRKNLLGAGERSLGVDQPFDAVQRRKEGIEH